MKSFEFRTAAGVDPRGKQKIYFCCHPNDLDKYLEMLSTDIFSCEENCAVYYDTGEAIDDRLSLLSEMQLFVVPVTANLLKEPCAATETDLPFALGKKAGKNGEFRHIAVLPILTESGLVDLFNESELLGGLQFLDKTCADVTAISYEEKLRNYLHHVLISAEEADKIRSEFRARIFLSYRKKDRAKAQELMKKIHSYDFCRDVSIWYDEFLTLGEKFDKSIENVMKDADLFVMNVTPGIVEEGNYICIHEFPDAVKLGMPLLPVETEDTDAEALETAFSEVVVRRLCTTDDEELREGLHRGLVVEAKKEELLTPDNNAEHLYYMGLAYKNGIDVESSADRAVKLFNEAAEGGFERAYITLAEMYETGDKAAVDFQKAKEFYQKFIDAAGELSGDDFEKDDRIADALYAIADISYNKQLLYTSALESVARYHEASLRMKESYGERAYRHLSRSYRLKSKPDMNDHRYHAVVSNTAEALTIDLHLLEADPSPASLFSVMGDHVMAGDAYTKLGNRSEAEEHFREALALYDRYGHLSSSQTLRVTAVCWDRLGSAAAASGDTEKAESGYQKAHDIIKQISKTDAAGDTGLDLCASYVNMAQIDINHRDYDAAEEKLRKAVGIAEKAADETGDGEAVSYAAVINGELAKLLRFKKNYKEAKKVYKRGIRYEKQRIEANEDIFALNSYAIACFELSDMLYSDYHVPPWEEKHMIDFETGMTMTEKAYYAEEARKTWENLYERTGDYQYASNLQQLKTMLLMHQMSATQQMQAIKQAASSDKANKPKKKQEQKAAPKSEKKSLFKKLFKK